MANFYGKYSGVFGGGGGGGGSTTFVQEVLTGTYAAGDTTYTLSQAPASADALLVILGVVPQPQSSYTLVSTTITFPGEDTTANDVLAYYAV